MTTDTSKSAKKKPWRIGQSLRRNFFAGLIVIMPFLLTFAIVRWVVLFIDSRIAPLLPRRFSDYAITHIGIDPFRDVPGAGIALFLIATTIIGIFARGLIGIWLINSLERLLNRMPLLPKIYTTMKQIFSTLFQQSQQSAFRKAVLVPYPHENSWTIGFVTAESSREILKSVGKEKMQVVFVPTSPNPTSGFVLFFADEKIIDLDISVEEAIKLVFSFGIVQPDSTLPKTEQLSNPPQR